MSIAYWCVLAAGLLPYLSVSVAKANSSYDNANPRNPDLYVGMARRAHAAHHNAFEAFPLFAVAVLVASHGMAQGSANALLDVAAAGWIALRLAYFAAYIGGWPLLRSALWTLALIVNVAIFTMPAWHA